MLIPFTRFGWIWLCRKCTQTDGHRTKRVQLNFQLRWIKYWFLIFFSNITILFNNALNVVHWYSIILRIADFKSPAFVDNCCTFILSIWILIQQTFDSVDRRKNKMKNTKRYTNGNKTTVFAFALMLKPSLFETYV